MVKLVRHRQPKGSATARLRLRPPRHTSTLPIAIFLLAGAVVNVAVAWGCAIAIDIRFDGVKLSKGVITSSEGHWEVTRVDRFGTTWVASTQSKSDFEEYFVTDTPPDAVIPSWGDLANQTDSLRSPNVEQEMRYVDARGWPMRSLWCDAGGWLGGPDIGRVGQPISGGIDTTLRTSLRISPPVTRVLPLRPIWSGFIVNTLVYAALISGAFVLRRFLRVRRGLCPKCAYPMGESAVCTECGKERPRRVRPAT